MESGALQHIVRACNKAEYFQIPSNTRLQCGQSNKIMKISLGKRSNLEFLGNSCLVFLRGRGTVECFGKDNQFYIHRDDANLLLFISRYASNKESHRYNLPEFDKVQVPESRPVKSAVHNSHSNHSTKDESIPLLGKEPLTNSAISPKAPAVSIRPTTTSEQSRAKVPTLPISLDTRDDWNALSLMSLGFGGLKYCRRCVYFSGIGPSTNYQQ